MLKYIIFIIIFIAVLSQPFQKYALTFDNEVERIISTMSVEEKCAQLLLIGTPGNRYVPDRTQSLLKKIPVGGIILFGFNVAGKIDGTYQLCGSLQDISRNSGAKIPLFIAIDHEGGTVFRFQSGITKIPSAYKIGSTNDESLIQQIGEISAKQLLAVGINLNLAPVVEVVDPLTDKVIGTRSFGKSPELVSKMSCAYISGVQKNGVISTAKHFPGNGNASIDPHYGMPTLNYTLNELQNTLSTFESAIDCGVSAIMLSHLLLPNIDSKYPVTLSHKIITGLLREKMGFSGMIISDDLQMKALLSRFTLEESAITAINAGVDMIMLTSDYPVEQVHSALCNAVKTGRISTERLDESINRILSTKLKYNLWETSSSEKRKELFDSLPDLVEQGNSIVERIK